MSIANTIKDEQIQEQILQSAKQLFGVYGLAKVTMDDVAKAVGKGRSSLYYYYKSKDEIFDAVVALEINSMIGAMEKAVDEVPRVEEKINALFIAKLKWGREKGSFFRAMETGMDADAISSFNKAKIVHHNLIIKREQVLFTRILTDGVATGELKPVKKNEMENLAFVMMSCLHGIKQEMRIENNVRAIEPIINQFASTFMNGLLK